MILAILFILLFAGPTWAQSIINLQADPGQSSMGFSRALWIDGLNVMVQTTGPGNDNNSIRAFNPITQVWTALRCNEINTAAPQCGTQANPPIGIDARDNYVSFYIPTRQELLIFGGSHMEFSIHNRNANWSGRLSLAGCFSALTANCATWVSVGRLEDNTAGNPFVGVIKNWDITSALIDPAVAWNATADAGIIFGGSEQGSPSNRYWIIEHKQTVGACGNSSGQTEPYIMCEVIGGTRPAAREQAMNLAASGDGQKVYLFSGENNSATFACTDDFWVYDFSTHAWTQKASPSSFTGGFNCRSAVLTYDSDRASLVAYAWGMLLEYSISTNAWANVTPVGLACVFNQTGVYSPTAALHIYEGGLNNDCVNNPISYEHVWGINVQGGFYLPPKVWVAYPYSAWPDNAPVKGFGGIVQSKHLNIQENPDNGKIYFSGGDWSGNDGDNTGVWVWDPLVHAAGNQTAAMVHERSNCGTQGEIIPGGPNESGFAWDSTRKKFVQLPGFWFFEQSGPSSCGGGGQPGAVWNVSTPLTLDGYAAYFAYDVNGTRYHPGVNFSVATNTPAPGQITLTNINIPTGGSNAGCGAPICIYWQTNGNALQLSTIMTYDPVTKVWANPAYARESGYNELPKNALYDPATDSIWRVGLRNSNVTFSRLHLDTGTWDYYEVACATGPATGPCAGEGKTYINSSNMGFEWITADLVRRKLYVIDPIQFLLLEFDMNTAQVTVKANPPLLSTSYCHNVNTCKDFTELFWDAAHNVLLFPAISSNNDANVSLLIWHPDTNTWEQDAMYAPNTPTDSFGRTVKADNFAFSKTHNFLMAVGGGWNPGAGANDNNLTQYHLYRYSAGSQTNGTRVLTIAASGSTQNVSVTVSPVDANGQGSGATQLIRRYDNGTAVTVIAPATSGSNNFSAWLGCDSTTTTTASGDTCHVAMNASKTVTATYAGGTTTFSLAVNSSPNSGAVIGYALNSGSCTAASSGATPFARTCDLNSSVTLTAPSSYAGNNFSAWSGCDVATTNSCTLTMNTNKSVTANYVAPVVPYTLTINSSAAAFLTVSLVDTNGSSDCNAPCTRVYNSGNSVTVTAPLMSGDASYTLWSGCSSISGAACTVAMSGNKTITVSYASGTTYQLSRDFSNVQGQRNWTYLDSTGTPMAFGGQYAGIWNGSETNLLLTPSGSHPGAIKGAMLRWTAPSDGSIQITGNAHDGAVGGGDGVDIAIKTGSVTLSSATINEGNVTGVNFNITIGVTAGQTIDFITSARSNALFDTTVFDPVIAFLAPQPQTVKVGAAMKVGAGTVFRVGGQ